MKVFKRILLCIFIVILGVSSYFISSGYKMYKDKINEKSIADRIEELKSDPSYTEISEVPAYYLNAVVAIEDHRFYSHFGVDVLATTRAMIDNIASFKMKGGRKFDFSAGSKEFVFYSGEDFD